MWCRTFHFTTRASQLVLQPRTTGSGLQQVFKLVMLRLVKLQRRLVTNCALLLYTTSSESNRCAQALVHARGENISLYIFIVVVVVVVVLKNQFHSSYFAWLHCTRYAMRHMSSISNVNAVRLLSFQYNVYMNVLQLPENLGKIRARIPSPSTNSLSVLFAPSPSHNPSTTTTHDLPACKHTPFHPPPLPLLMCAST